MSDFFELRAILDRLGPVAEDAKYARTNAEGAEFAVRHAQQAILERLDGIEQALADAPSAHALRGALKVLSRDMHVVSTRPCDTCRMVSAALGEPFGCSARAERLKKGVV